MTKKIRELIEREAQDKAYRNFSNQGDLNVRMVYASAFKAGAQKMYEIMREREQKALGVLAALLETHECRAGEDCDHCLGEQVLAELSETEGEGT